MKGDFQVRFCERLKLQCFGLLDPFYNRLFVLNKIFRSFMGIVIGADTALNAQSCGKPIRWALLKNYDTSHHFPFSIELCSFGCRRTFHFKWSKE